MKTKHPFLALAALAVLAALAGCNSPPETRLSLTASRSSVDAGGDVLFTATLVQGGKALEDVEVVFTATEGTFTTSATVQTDAAGQASANLTADPDGGIMTVVTATADSAKAAGSFTLEVLPAGGGGGGGGGGER